MSNPGYPGYAGSYNMDLRKRNHQKIKKKPASIPQVLDFPWRKFISIIFSKSKIHWIGLRENLQENLIFNGKHHGFL